MENLRIISLWSNVIMEEFEFEKRKRFLDFVLLLGLRTTQHFLVYIFAPDFQRYLGNAVTF